MFHCKCQTSVLKLCAIRHHACNRVYSSLPGCDSPAVPKKTMFLDLFHVLTGRRGRRNSSELGWRVVWLWSTHQNGHAEATECRRLFLASTVQLLKRLDEYTRGFVWSCSSDLHRSVCSSEWWSIILGWWWSSASGRERRVFILGVLLIGSFIDSFVLSASYY